MVVPPNALIYEASPYLRQHANNPVAWLPWSPAAFEKARRERKPLFLSIGYAACHWCHVMAHESFEDDSVAAVLNERFVPVKVDREERPDVDHHYMQAIQSLTGHGGWPLSVFLTPDLKPFFGGTYWPPAAKWGKPGFLDVLQAVSRAWQERPSEVMASAVEIHNALEQIHAVAGTEGEIRSALLDQAVSAAERHFDRVYGGFGSAPKFPHPMELSFLLRRAVRKQSEAARRMAVFTLQRMARGGVYDQFGGGFHRYSTDARWLVPHFEKMLYDNALLVPVYLDAHLITGEALFRRIGQEILDWALREMAAEGGGFVSSLDADSEGEEGKFYVWTPAEVQAVLGEPRGQRICRIYDISENGNFEGGRSIPNLQKPLAEWATALDIPLERLRNELAEDRAALRAARDERVRPERDGKILTDWNGLMISALVRGWSVLGEERYLEAARATADRLLRPFEERGVLVHSELDGQTQEIPLLLDYATLGSGLLDLYSATGETRWFAGSTALARRMDELFTNPDGPYFMSAEGVAGTRAVDPYDSALPAGISVAGNLHARLHHLTGDPWYLERAQKQVKPLAGLMEQMPSAFSQALQTVEWLLSPPPQLVLAGDDERTLWKTAQEVVVPGLLPLWRNAREPLPPGLETLAQGAVPIEGQATAYLCREFVCDLPTTSADDLRRNLQQAAVDSAA